MPFRFLLPLLLLLASDIASAQTRWQQLPGPIGGEAWLVVRDSSDRLFAIVGNGLYRSVDDGDHWSPLPNAPRNPSAIVVTAAGTLLCDGDPAKHLEGTVSRSTDGGDTWEFSDEGLDPRAGPFDRGLFVGRTSGAVFAATRPGLFRSSDDGLTWTKISDLLVHNLVEIGRDLYMTSDGRFLKMSEGAGRIDVVPDEEMITSVNVLDNGLMFAAFGRHGLEKLHRSLDSGATWTPTDMPLNEYVSIVDIGGGTLLAYGYRAFLSRDSGATWTAFDIPSTDAYDAVTGRDGTIVLATTVGPLVSHDRAATWRRSIETTVGHRIDRIVAGAGRDVVFVFTSSEFTRNDVGDGLYRSDDAGMTWRSIREGLPAVTSLLATVDDDTLYAAAGMELHRSTDGGTTWALRSAQSTNIHSLSAAAGMVVVTHGVGRLSVSTDGGATWTTPPNGTTYFSDTKLCGVGALVAATNIGILSSRDAGVTWTTITSIGTLALAMNEHGTIANGQAPNVTIVDRCGTTATSTPTLPAGVERVAIDGDDNVYALTQKTMLRSTDRGVTWTPFIDGLLAIPRSVASGRDGRVYCGTAGAGLFRLDAGAAARDEAAGTAGASLAIMRTGDGAAATIALEHRAHVRLTLYDLRGAKLATVIDGDLEHGAHELRLPDADGVVVAQLCVDGVCIARTIVID